MASEPSQSFHPFPRLPTEIQIYIWQLATGDSGFLWAEWPGPGLTMLAPVVEIPALGTSDQIGLIPYPLADDMPKTLPGYELSGLGIPTGLTLDHWVDWDTYEKMMLGENWTENTLTRWGRSWKKSLIEAMGIGDGFPKNIVNSNPSMDHLMVSRLSRSVAFHQAIVKTNQILPANTASASSKPTFYPVRNGALSAHIFNDHQIKRKTFVYVIGLEKSTATIQKSMFTKAVDLNRFAWVAARLADIERCIFGHRLSLNIVPEGLDNQRLLQLDWAVWWRPDLGARARRPEANHPFFLTPESIFAIYSTILHRLVGDFPQKETPCPSNTGYDGLYEKGEWYFRLVQTGECSGCGKPLRKDLCQNFPQLIDENGCINTLVLLDRSAFERPQMTIGFRDHEVLV